MKTLLLAVAGALMTTHAIAQDFVARAQTTCKAAEGTDSYGACMTNAARSICGSLDAHVRVSCFEDFQRFFLASADQADRERRAFAANIAQRMERLRALGAVDSDADGYFAPKSNVGRTLDDGLPDTQPSWGTGGDPYEHLRRYLPPSESPAGAPVRQRPTVAIKIATCDDMTTREDALDYLRRGATQLDGDHDGYPCEGKFR